MQYLHIMENKHASLRVLAQIVFELLVFEVEQEIFMISENVQKDPPNLSHSSETVRAAAMV